MNADDYKKLKDIFQAAVELPPDERSAYLDEKCDGNVELRSEVERLLDSLDEEFLERPAVEPISSPVSGVSLSGQRVGHYNVIRKIGSGGMGDVYLATDGKLGRRVAVKILPEEFTSEQDRLDRFQLEARAASALSHPNILTIHEIGEWAGTHYIATEYVEGETLRHRISRERLSVPETLEVGVQLVSAIAAAHEAGICHRDIKPENIMIRRDGIIKVVDFGLVKLTPSLLRGNPARPTSAGDPTVKIVRTDPGVIMGTVQYMSPEQTRSLPTDERTDIWSLGCVLYEMLAGRAPFEGENSADLIAEIVKTYPAPPSSLNPDVPERLDEIVGKALEKNPDERYQTAKDLLIDLKRLKRRFDVDVELERSQPRITTSDENVISGPNIISTKKGPKDLTEVNSAQYLYWGMKAHRWTAIGIALLIIGLVGGTALLVRYYWAGPNEARIAYAGKMRLALQSLEASNLDLVGELLEETKPSIGEDDLRGFEWAYLSRVRTERVASQPIALEHTDLVDGVAFSPSGEFLATACNDHTITLWNVATGGKIRTFKGHTSPVTSVKFSPDGRRFVSRGFDNTARVWEVATGREELSIADEIGPTPTFTNDGSKIVGISHGRMRLWDSATGQVLSHPIEGLGAEVSFALSPDGKMVAISNGDNSVAVTALATGRRLATLKGHSSLVVPIVFSDDSRRVFTGSVDGTVRLWDPRTGRLIRTFEGHAGNVFDVAITPDGRTAATGSADDTIKLWDVENGFEIATLYGSTGDIMALAFTPDGRKLASGSSDNAARLWNLPPKGGRGVLRGHSAAIKSISISGDGKLLASASEDNTAKIWDVETETERLTLVGHTDPVNAAVFAPNGRELATASKDGTVRRWDITTGRQLASIKTSVPAYTLSFSPDGRYLAVAYFIGRTKVDVLNPANGEIICSINVGQAGAWGIEFSPDGSQLTSWNLGSALRAWSPATCSLVWERVGPGTAEYVSAFAPDGRIFAIERLNNGRSLKVLDKAGAELSSIDGHEDDISTVKISADGKRVLTSGRDGRLKLWDIVTGQEMMSIRARVGVIESALFSPDGRFIAAAGSDGTIRLWRGDS